MRWWTPNPSSPHFLGQRGPWAVVAQMSRHRTAISQHRPGAPGRNHRRDPVQPHIPTCSGTSRGSVQHGHTAASLLALAAEDLRGWQPEPQTLGSDRDALMNTKWDPGRERRALC